MIMKKIVLIIISITLFLTLSCRETADTESEYGRVAYLLSDSADIYRVNSDGSENNELLVPAYVTGNLSLSNSFARSASYIASGYDDSVNQGLSLAMTDGGGVSRIPLGLSISSVSVSPDQQYIVYVTNTADCNCVMTANPTSPVFAAANLPGTPPLVSWSPDSRYFVFVQNITNWEIMIGKTDGTVRQVTDNTAGHLFYNPKWSPDGEYIVFSSNQGGAYYLERMRPDGSERIIFASGITAEKDCSWSPDATQIAYADNSVIFIIDNQTLFQRTVSFPFDSQTVRWSYFGTKLLVAANNGIDGSDIFVVDPESGSYTLVAGGAGNQTDPLWLMD